MNERKEKEGGCRCSASHSTGTCFLDRWSVQHMLSNCRSLSTVISIYVGIVRFHGEAVALSPWLAYCQSSSPSPCCSRGFQKNRFSRKKIKKEEQSIVKERSYYSDRKKSSYLDSKLVSPICLHYYERAEVNCNRVTRKY